LTKLLKKEPAVATSLAALLQAYSVDVTKQTATVAGDNNKIGQASGGSSIKIS